MSATTPKEYTGASRRFARLARHELNIPVEAVRLSFAAASAGRGTSYRRFHKLSEQAAVACEHALNGTTRRDAGRRETWEVFVALHRGDAQLTKKEFEEGAGTHPEWALVV